MRDHSLNMGETSMAQADSDSAAFMSQDSILKHHVECKLDNKLRLKQVTNLEELIHFKIKTVSDKLVEDGSLVHPVSQKKGLYALRKVVDPLLTSQAFPAVTSFSKATHHDNDSSHKSLSDVQEIATADRQPPQLKPLPDPLNEDSLMEDMNIGIDDSESHTKINERPIMTKSGTILIPKQTVNE